jgi:hypothetical protein
MIQILTCMLVLGMAKTEISSPPQMFDEDLEEPDLNSWS